MGKRRIESCIPLSDLLGGLGLTAKVTAYGVDDYGRRWFG